MRPLFVERVGRVVFGATLLLGLVLALVAMTYQLCLPYPYLGDRITWISPSYVVLATWFAVVPLWSFAQIWAARAWDIAPSRAEAWVARLEMPSVIAPIVGLVMLVPMSVGAPLLDDATGYNGMHVDDAMILILIGGAHVHAYVAIDTALCIRHGALRAHHALRIYVTTVMLAFTTKLTITLLPGTLLDYGWFKFQSPDRLMGGAVAGAIVFGGAIPFLRLWAKRITARAA